MSLEFAKNTGLILRQDNTAFKLSNGSICHAIGRVHIRCTLVKISLSDRKRIGQQEFYVLERAFAPLVLGLPFLQEAGLLHNSCDHHILHQQASPAQLTATRPAHNSCYAIMCLKVLLTQQHLTREAIAIPDNGANLNLMSLEYAKGAGFNLDRSSGAELPLTIGNGHTVFTVGKVFTMIHLHQYATSSDRISITFFVVNGLVADVVLGRHFSKKNRLFETHQPLLQWVLIERDAPGFLGGAGDSGYHTRKVKPKEVG
jgi:hypothetical protein